MAALGSFTAFESDALSVAVGAVSVAVDVEVLLAPPPDDEDDEDDDDDDDNDDDE